MRVYHQARLRGIKVLLEKGLRSYVTQSTSKSIDFQGYADIAYKLASRRGAKYN
tara:strand:- start:303 stop:464 length:162 start_codon:yes stop_codon:yes gene_type:complete